MLDKIRYFYNSSLKGKFFIQFLMVTTLIAFITGFIVILTAQHLFWSSRTPMYLLGIQLFSGILVVALIIYLSSKFFTKQITSPLDDFAKVIEEMSRGNFSKRIESGSIDEVGRLAASFNLMAEKLECFQLEMDDKIKAQEKHLLNILNWSTDGIISLDVEDRIMTWNKGAELIYGYKAEEVKGRHLDMLIPPELRQKGEVEKMSALLKERGHLRHHESERIRKDGKRILVDITKNLLKDRNGNTIGYSAIVKDITEKREFERMIMQTEKLTTMGQISANIAHELRNPLMGISGAVQVVMKKLEGNPQLWETLKKIFEQVQRLDSTLKGLLSFARPQAPYFTKCDINEIIDQILFFISPEAQAKNIEIKKKLTGTLPEISLDPDQIKQVMLNLVLNAIQAMPEGGELYIETDSVSGNGNGEAVRVVIRDTGVGIPEEIREEIFKPFFTTKTKGTGLGLVISRNIVKEHGGKIDFTSSPSRGSSFEVTLPVQQ